MPIHSLFIHGEKDPLIPLVAGIATAHAVPHGKMMVIPGMGHMMFNRELERKIADIVLSNLRPLLTRMM